MQYHDKIHEKIHHSLHIIAIISLPVSKWCKYYDKICEKIHEIKQPQNRHNREGSQDKKRPTKKCHQQLKDELKSSFPRHLLIKLISKIENNGIVAKLTCKNMKLPYLFYHL